MTGNVQGVNLRSACREKANDLGLFGFVQNMQDGSVYLEIEGEAAAMDQFLDDFEKGLAVSSQLQVTKSKIEAKSFSDFSIRFVK